MIECWSLRCARIAGNWWAEHLSCPVSTEPSIHGPVAGRHRSAGREWHPWWQPSFCNRHRPGGIHEGTGIRLAEQRTRIFAHIIVGTNGKCRFRSSVRCPWYGAATRSVASNARSYGLPFASGIAHTCLVCARCGCRTPARQHAGRFLSRGVSVARS